MFYQFGFAYCFLPIRLKLCLWGRNRIEVMLCSSIFKCMVLICSVTGGSNIDHLILYYEGTCSFFFWLKKCYWNIVALQCCVSFRSTAKWFSYIEIFSIFFSIIGYYKTLNYKILNLCYTVNPCLSILYIVACIY